MSASPVLAPSADAAPDASAAAVVRFGGVRLSVRFSELASTAAITLGLRGGLLAGQFLAMAVITHGIPIELVGVFSLVFASQTVMRFLGAFGLDQIVVREMAAIAGDEPLAMQARITRTALKTNLVTSLVAAALLGTVVVVFAGPDPLKIGPVLSLVVLAMLPMTSTMGVLSAATRVVRGSTRAQLPEVVLFYLALLGGVIGCRLAGVLSLQACILSLAAAQACAILGFLWDLRRVLVAPAGEARFRIKPKEAFLIFSGLGVLTAVQRAPVPIAFMLFGAVQAGLTDIAWRVAALSSLVSWALGFVITPTVTRAWVSGDRQQTRRLLAVASLFCGVCALGQLGAVALLGRQGVSLVFGAKYGAAYGRLVLLSLAYVGNSVFGPWSPIYRASQRDDLMLTWSIVSAIAFGGVLAATIPFVGGLSVIYATVAGMLVRDFLVFVGALGILRTGWWPYTPDLLRVHRDL